MTISIQQMADRVAELLEARMRIRGDGLTAKLQRAGRRLPRRVLAAAEVLAVNAETARVPRLYAQVDVERAAQAYDVCMRHLAPLGANARRATLLWGMVGSLAIATLVTVALGVGVLVWRGYL